MHIFSCMFSEVMEFSKILGKIFGEEECRVPRTFLLQGKWSWQGMEWVTLNNRPLERAPVTLVGPRVADLNEIKVRQ